MTHRQFQDASTTDGLIFELQARRKHGILIIKDDAPVQSRTCTAARLNARRYWRTGIRGQQIGFDLHGKVQILRLENGTEIAVWWDETLDVQPVQA